MADIRAIVQYYVRRNLRLRARGIKVPSFRDSVFSESRFDKDPKGKTKAELKKRVENGEARWVTIKGTKVCIENGSNKILAGPDAFVGKTPSDAFGIKWGKEPKDESEAETKDTTEEAKSGEEQKKAAVELQQDRVERGKTTGPQLAEIQKNLTLSEDGENESCGGFRVTGDRDFLAYHADKHKEDPDFEKMTPDEYEAAAVKMLQMPCGGSIVGGLKKETYDGVEVTAVIRYDKETGLFAKGYPGGFVLTFLKAKYFVDRNVGGKIKREYNPNWKEDGYRYFLKAIGKTESSSKDEVEQSGQDA